MKRKNLMKLIVGVVLVTVMAVALALAGGCAAPGPAPAPTPAPAQELPIYRLRMQTSYPPAQAQDITRTWLDNLERALGGRVIFDLYCGGEIVSPDQMIPAVQAGTLDFVQTTGPDSAAPVDIARLDGAPAFMWNSATEILTLYEEEGLLEIYAGAYEELGGLKYLGMNTCDPCHLVSTRPIESYEDLAGLKISAHSSIVYPLEEAGATSVVIPLDEIYLAGKTGIVDAMAWSGSTETVTNGWHEVYTYFLNQPMNGAWVLFTMASSKTWDTLPSDIQEIILLSMKDLQVISLTYYYEREPIYRPYFTITNLPDEDMARLRESARRQWDELSQESARMAEVIEILKTYDSRVTEAEWWR